MMKVFKEKYQTIRVVMEVGDVKCPVNFKIKKNGQTKIDGCFMLLKPEKMMDKEEEK
jgi:hypothetical protein